MDDLETERMRIRRWFFEPGENGRYHIYDIQEEVYFVVAGHARATAMTRRSSPPRARH